MNLQNRPPEDKEFLLKLIRECESIEKELRRYKLWGNLIPTKTWYNNLRRIVPASEWTIVRKAAYEYANHHCLICGTTNVQLHAHEAWSFNYQEAHQQLVGILALCEWCHYCQHLGHAGILIDEKKLDEKKLADHWCRVNKLPEEEFKRQKELAFRLWRLRNRFPWKLVDKMGNPIEKLETAEQVLQLVGILDD